MKSKMWNKIFKNKSSKSSSSSASVTITETNELDDNNLFDDPQHHQQQQMMIASSSTSSSSGGNNNNHPLGHSTKSSKLSKMVNSFTLKRNSNKENGNNNGYNSDVAISIIRNAELNNDNSKFNINYNKNKNIKYMKRQKSIDHRDDGGCDDDLIPIMVTTNKLIKTTPPDDIPLSPKSDFNDSNFPISPEPSEPIELQPCPICARKFVPVTLTKHVDICERMATKKRKKFDSFRQRREGTDLADYLPKNFGLPTTGTVNQPAKQQTINETKILSPKIQIEESTPIAAHKQFDTESKNLQNPQKKSSLNPISPSSKQIRSKNLAKRLAPQSEKCPHCERSFGVKAFDRHVDWCKEKSRIQAMKNNADLKSAKDRLEARTKYKAPNLKAKREAIRNKYAGNGDDGHSIDDNRSVDNNVFSMSNSLSSSFMSDGISQNFNNENSNHEILNDVVKIDNNEKIFNKIKPLSINTEKISKDDNQDLSTVDRIEIEEIIPLNSKNNFNFDDTPIRPAKNIFIEKPTNNYDENPIRPSKTILNDVPALILPIISANRSANAISDLAISSPKSFDKEESLNGFIDQINEPTKNIIKDKPINNFDEMPIRTSKKKLTAENDLPLCTPISIVKQTLQNEFVENLPESSETIQQDSQQNLQKNNFDDIKIRPVGSSIYNKSLISPKISNTEDFKSDCTISPLISMVEEKRVNGFLTNRTTILKTVNGNEPKVNCNDIPVRLAKASCRDNVKNTRASNKLSLNMSISNKINADLEDVTSIESPKVILKDKHVSQFHEMEIKTSKPKMRNTSSNRNDFNETSVKPKKNAKSNNADDVSIQSLKPIVKSKPKVSIDQINIRAGYTDKISFILPIISNEISAESENITPIQVPKLILKDDPINDFDGIEIRTSKPILRNTKSINDIPNKLSKESLTAKYSNNFNKIPIRSQKKILNTRTSHQPIISTKNNEEIESRSARSLSLKTILPPINRPSLASISSDDFDKLLSSSDQINGRRESQILFEVLKKSKKNDDKISLPKVYSNTIKDALSSDGSENFWMQISNDTMSETSTERPKLTEWNLNEENFNKKSGFSDKYDPFLSAKRQLEELCSPTAEAESPFTTKQHNPATSTPITIKPKLTSSLSTSYTAPTPNPRNTLNTVKSNFRRTSSLRSPRKNNPCPRPLFVPPSRCLRPTTIQRGISDEGPISTNFIRPEEYDEMPVKSACINNFATAINSPQFSRRDSSPQKLLSRSTSRESSPLVIKRDPNANLNRRNLRLNLGNNKELNNDSSNNIPLLKTDSLAVFLKYETELTKNPSDKLISSLKQLGNTPPIVLPQQNPSSTTPPISEKDWKDKSNTLSKQNSLKNSSSDLVEKTFGNVEKEKLTLLKNSLTNLLDSGNKLTDIPKKLPPTISSPPDVNTPMPLVNKSLPIKLEPLHQKVYKNTATPPPSKVQSPPVVAPSLAPLFPQIKSTPMTVAINNNLINLNSILTIDSKEMDNNNFIDPKLINICDNLQVNTNSITSTKQSDDSDLTSVGSQDSAYRPKTAPILLTDERNSSGHQSSESVIEKSPSPPTTLQRTEHYQHQTSSNRNSSDKKNLLKRQIRLGKNQFLYDASPSDSEPSPDPLIHKSQNDLLASVTSTTTHLPLVESSEKQFDSLLSPSNNPIFNNFDFEEFLSSFEASNDDDEDQFPGFKDCKEFLMNRCLNMRSMNNNFINNNNNNSNFFNNTQNSIRSRKIELDPMMMLNDSSRNNNNKRQPSHDDDDDVQIVHDEREIFISIETDQNENETSNPCPNDPSIQNPKIEEINCNDNKFTKIETYHLPIFEEKDEHLTTDFINDVTIRRNNVKNKQHHEDIKENITCDSVTSMYPVDSDERSSVECYPIGRRSGKSKTSADSAYGSLSRQSPTLTDRSSIRRNSASQNNNHRLPNEQNIQSSDTNMMIQSNEPKRRNRELSASSSGSENSLPPINSHHNHHHQQTILSSYQEESNLQNSKESFGTTSMDFGSLPSPGGQQTQQHQMSKFCHECGSRFLVSQAKFCMECGVKRIILK